MSDEQEPLPPTIRTAHLVNRRDALGTFAACLAVAPAAASPPAPFRLAPFPADVTPPLGHALMGGGIAPACVVIDPLLVGRQHGHVDFASVTGNERGRCEFRLSTCGSTS
jgi:hypothetical protein